MGKGLVTLVAVVAMVASACGSGETEAGSDETTDEASEYVYESPLGDFLGWTDDVDFDEESAEAEFRQQEQAIQEQIAACMRAEGFEYKPVDQGQFASFEDPFEGEEWGTLEWFQKYGFGVSTQRYSQEQVGPDLVGFPGGFFGPGDEFVDPNEEYVNSLTEAEQAAYYGALYGADEGIVFDFELEDREPTQEEMAEIDEYYENEYVPTGCEPVAYEEAFGGPGGPGGGEQYEAFDEEFGNVLDELYQRMEASPELTAYRAEVEACVIEQGFEYLTEEDAYMYFEEKMMEAGLGYFDPLEGVDVTGWTEEQFEEAYRDAETAVLPADQLAALAEIQQEEIETAVVVFECGGGWENESKIMDSVRIELEEQFLADNADRLAEYEGVFSDG